MNADDIQQLKNQLNIVRRSFYLGANQVLGIDISGIPLPHEDPSITGGFQEAPLPQVSYEYMSPTAFDRAQMQENIEHLIESIPPDPPRIYIAMGTLLNEAVQYLEARQDMGNESSMAVRKRNLVTKLQAVREAAKHPPFPAARAFVDDVVRYANTAYVLTTSDRPLTTEGAEMQFNKQTPTVMR